MFYVTSDTHFCHNKEFLYGPRGFSSVDEMNEAIVDNWNRTVKHDDTVYLLGDVMLNDDKTGHQLLSSLNGHIHLIFGNHDTMGRICNGALDTWNMENCGYAEQFKFNGYRFYLTHYPTLTSNFDSGQPLKRMLINLCGHSHTQDRFQDWGKNPIYHCELDAHNCTPVSMEEIISDIEAKFNA